jgi:hypothetical protein
MERASTIYLYTSTHLTGVAPALPSQDVYDCFCLLRCKNIPQLYINSGKNAQNG